MRSAFTCFALRPEQISRRSVRSTLIDLLGLLMSFMALRTGLSSRYLRSAHIRLCTSLAVLKSSGEEEVIVPRLMEEMKPDLRSMERMPRFCLVW